ncbi:MAG: RDD family protein [Pseudomonadota bacterium]|nr:RDD family protein [Pseudomonadota bacterium]|tara:strand:- start:249 stop:653 length:405 start_codon:yes stop_codon:yes gene_type:complete
MNNSIDKYENIGFLKNMVICLYDLMLLFSVLFFMSLPWIMITSGEAITNNIFYQFYLLLIILIYYLWFWVNHGQTLGMKSWKTYVLNQNNQTITIRQGMIRILISLVGGHLLLIFNKKSLQDIISKTHIIVKRT